MADEARSLKAYQELPENSKPSSKNCIIPVSNMQKAIVYEPMPESLKEGPALIWST